MNRFSGPLNLFDNGDSDVESLQTDVMRFLAIIALCLLAVFAAVSSEPPPAVKAMSKVQQVMIASLQKDLDEVQSDYRQDLAKVTEDNKRLQQQLDDKPTNSAGSDTQASDITELRAQTRTLQDRLMIQNGELQESRTRNARLRSSLNNLKASHQQAIKQLQAELDEARVRGEAVEPEAPQTETAVESDKPTAVQEPQDKGFSLAFASDEALLRLVKYGRVSLFIKADRQVWQYNATDRAFGRIDQVAEFYQLSSIAPELAGLAQRQLGEAQGEWGVSFDAVIRAELNRLLAQYESGDIIVKKSGALEIKQ